MDDTQEKNVLEHLRSGQTITPLEALRLYGSLRLGAIIHVLRKKFVGTPYSIETENEKKLDEKTGRTKTYARYRLVVQTAPKEQPELF